ncbi:MAG: methylated-DNA--[protein]-cysteine S-methyltransferase [Solirubrobacteraceae bacterium]
MNITADSDALPQRLRDEVSIDADHFQRLTATLAAQADREGLLDIAYETHDSPLGPMLVAATHAGLIRVGLPLEGESAVLDELSTKVSRRILIASRPAITSARRQLDDYFAQRLTSFDVALDWQLTGGFRRRVLDAAREIPYGQTASYRDVATRAGNPNAVRAAGTALATNPLPIVVPCHRVVRSDGHLGAYRGGPDAKALLIAIEEEAVR